MSSVCFAVGNSHGFYHQGVQTAENRYCYKGNDESAFDRIFSVGANDRHVRGALACLECLFDQISFHGLNLFIDPQGKY